jgi:hypothetical protein
MKQVRVAGHALFREGRPVQKVPCSDCADAQAHTVPQYVSRQGGIVQMVQWSKEGHAACECGWVGTHRQASRKRQEDPRRHKQSVAALLVLRETAL